MSINRDFLLLQHNAPWVMKEAVAYINRGGRRSNEVRGAIDAFMQRADEVDDHLDALGIPEDEDRSMPNSVNPYIHRVYLAYRDLRALVEKDDDYHN